MWCYLIIACFDWEIGVSKQTVVRAYRILKISTPKQMLQRLPILLAQVKAGNTSANSLNEIRQIMSLVKGYNEFNKVIKHNGYYIYEFWKC